MNAIHDFGIVANVAAVDRVFRMGSKAFLVGGTGGAGWYAFEWIGRTRSGDLVRKWTPTKRFSNFRCAWIPKHIRIIVGEDLYLSGTREEMEKISEGLNLFCEKL